MKDSGQAGAAYLDGFRGDIKDGTGAVQGEGHAAHRLHLVLRHTLPQVVEHKARLEYLTVIAEQEGGVVFMRRQQ